MSTTIQGAWLILGRPSLLSVEPRLHDDDVIAIAAPPGAPQGSPPNTVILGWNNLGPVTVTVRTVDGQHACPPTVIREPLYDGLLPGPALRDLVNAVPNRLGWRTPTPLLYAIAVPTSEGTDLAVYSPVDRGADDICLIRTHTIRLSAAIEHDLSWLNAALAHHGDQATSLNSDECAWRKAFPGQELEYKYTLPPDTEIFDLAADTFARARTGDLPGFTLKFHDAFQTWDYLNHLYEIAGPTEQRGYVSFIPAVTRQGWLMKRKWFVDDAFARREQLTDLPPLTSFDDHVRDVLHVDARRLPTFRRIRYDINVESLLTGHYYGIFFDRCHLTDLPGVAMCQCEVEYYSTRTTSAPDEQQILAEIDRVADLVDGILNDHGIRSTRGHYSKLSWLRSAARDHPELPSDCTT